MNRLTLIVMLSAAGMFVVAGIILNRRLRRDTLLATRVREVQRTVV